MDGEKSADLWYQNVALRQYVVDHAKSLTKDEDLRADLMQEAWAAICVSAEADASEELLMECARKAQDHYYREEVPRAPRPRGNKVLTVRVDEEHQLWLNSLMGKLQWPMSAVLRLVIEKGSRVLLDELST